MNRNRPMSRARRTSPATIWLSAGLCMAALITTAAAQVAAPRTQNQEQVGWVSIVDGMRHFSGMRCPDVVGPFFRTKVLAADADRLAGCQYSAAGGMQAIMRKHLSGTGASAARAFLNNYRAGGFSQAKVTGIAETGVTFITGGGADSAMCETLWRFSGEKSDYTLWLSYTLPAQETQVGPAVAAFKAMLTRQD